MSENVGVPLNKAFRYEGVRIVFKGRARDPGRSYLFMDPHGLQVRMSADELSRNRSSGDMPDWVDVPERQEGVRSMPVRNSWERATDAERTMAARALDYCLAWAADRSVPRSRAGLAPVIAAVYERRILEAAREKVFEPPAPSASTLQKWLAKWDARSQVADALLAQNALKGNRGSKLGIGMSLKVRNFIDDNYLTPHRWTVAKVHEELCKALAEENRHLPEGDRRRAPSYEAVRKAVGDLCKYTVDFCREGARVANERYRAIGSGIVTTHANQVWEIDDTLVDLFCLGQDGKTVVGRPWLIVVIDRHTRMIMSFLITFRPPDTTAAMEVLKRAMLRKEGLLERHGLIGEWPAHGRPDEIHVDNAKHYNSSTLKFALARLGIQLHTMPVLKAWYKGTVERLIGTVMRQVFHVVPGTTYSNIFERDGETPPETVAEATIDEARAKLLDWVVRTYQHRVHRGISFSPYAMWKESTSVTEMKLDLDRTDIEVALSLTTARAVRKEGLQFLNLMYTSEEYVRFRMLPLNERLDEVRIRIDRENLEVIYFLDPHTGDWLPAYLKDDLRPRVRGRTLEEYEMAYAVRKNRQGEFGDADPNWTATYAALERSIDDQATSPRNLHKVRAEAARESMANRAGRRLTPRDDPAHERRDDLASLVERAASEWDGERLASEKPPVVARQSGSVEVLDGAVSLRGPSPMPPSGPEDALPPAGPSPALVEDDLALWAARQGVTSHVKNTEGQG